MRKSLLRSHWLLGTVLLASLARAQTAPDPNRQETPSVLLPGSYWEEDRKPLQRGERAPQWVLPLAAESPHSRKGIAALDFTRWRGRKKTVVVFWAFWCDTWKDATRYFGEVRGDLLKSDIGLVAIAVDASQQPVARPAFKSGKLYFPVAIDTKSQTTSDYGVRRVPTVFVVAADGKIQAVWEGLPSKKELRKVLAAK